MKSMIQECINYLDENVPLTPRLQNLREIFFEGNLSICPERAKLWTESFRQTEGEPMILRRAKALEHVLSEMTIYIKDGDLLVGNMASVPRAAPIFPEFSVDWIESELNGVPYAFGERPGDAYQVSDEAREILLNDVIPYWRGKTHEDRVNALLPEETRLACKEVKGTEEDWIMTSGDGHTIPDYVKVIQVGMERIIKEAEDKIASLDIGEPDQLAQLPFLQSVIITQKAVLKFAARYADKLWELAQKEANPKRKTELTELSEICRRIPAKPARTFQEAAQAMLFVNIPIQLENNGHSISFGRVDQYLYPFFLKDIEENRLTIEKTFEIMSCLWLKVTEFAKLRDWPNTVAFVGNPLFQNLTIGGQTLNGQDAVNELSYLALGCTKKLKMTQPSLTVRWYKGTPDIFMKEAVKVIRTVGSLPAFFNDEVIIPSMLNIGYSYEDASNYGMVGCVEPAPHGQIGGRYGAGFPNFAKWVELAVNGGRDPRTGYTLCPQKGDLSTFETFGDLMDAFRQQLEFFLRQHVIAGNVVDYSWEELTPNPFLSSVIEDCIQRGREIKKGGAKYDFTGGQCVGVISAANALATIKKVVFEEKRVTREQLMHALATNFEDMTTDPSGEEIRQILLKADSKFGNDNDEPDEIAAEIMKYWSDREMTYKNTRYGKGPIGGVFIPSTATVASHVLTGQVVGATADGRKEGTPITEGTSAFRDTERKGPTALLNSYAKLPNVLMPGGQLFNVKITPSAVDSDKGLDNWVSLIKGAFEKKAMQLQFNVVSTETLMDAKEKPDNYSDLIVRVAGYSGYFVDLRPEVQEDIIARTEHNL
ncbi:glycyl radical protein [Christensenella hongkongensis]|uniref:glycyl radical protein n=1 Tax=Christensenella hongkongensis TaxID=270498 RepID=UPI002673972D|nr:glycyl radical protein [Christensenella hongkongensis]